MADVLVVSAHPDDVELACAGTVAKYVNAGKTVALFDLTRGELGTRGTPEQRLQEASAAAKVLGVTIRENAGLPDGRISDASETQKLAIISAIRRHQPKILMYPYPEDRHPDHGACGRLCEQASFLAGLTKIVDGNVPHRPQLKFAFHQAWEQKTTFIVDVTDTWETRMAAMRCFQSQFHDPNSQEPETWIASSDFLEGIEARGRNNGFKIGVKYGESFWHRGPLPVLDLMTLFPESKRHV
ncbi:MAG: bacillithiol biosynthesis deacetylase BshB1 [bacterium]|nr:bacillithiol biosynthesis deacetylase BshB1 [bacterium]